MPYDIKITEYPDGETFKTQIEELKELKVILERYAEKTIEVEFHKVLVKK
jgi:hypothetical protein